MIFSIFQLVALALFLILTITRSIQVTRRTRINPIAFLRARDIKHGILEAGFFLIVNLWALTIVFAALGWQPPLIPAVLNTVVINNLWTKLLGVVAVVTGLILNIRAHRSLGDAWRLGIDELHPGKLVTTGIYAFSRNPIFLFFILYFLGTFLINGTLLFLVFAIIVLLIIGLNIKEEERFLARVFGQDYLDYRQRVGRFWTIPPGVKKKIAAPERSRQPAPK